MSVYRVFGKNHQGSLQIVLAFYRDQRYLLHPTRRVMHMNKTKILEMKEKKQMVFINYSSTNEQTFDQCMDQIIKAHNKDKKKLA